MAKPKSQSEKFKEAAKQVGADLDEKAFDDALKKLGDGKKHPKTQDKPSRK